MRVLFQVGWMALHGQSMWTNPNLIAVVWLGREAAGAGLPTATFVGFVPHRATSVVMVMGLVAIPFLYRLPAWQTVLVAFIYALASYPLVFTTVMTWANPLMVERTALAPMTAAHALFGLVLGGVYLGLRRPPRSDPYSVRREVR